MKRRLAKPSLVLLAVAVLALVISACASFKEGSLRVGQPAGIGSVRVHFELCTEPESSAEGLICTPNEEDGQSQYMLGFIVPSGSGAPGTITAQPANGAQPIAYTRNAEVAQAIIDGEGDGSEEWPPAGTEVVGYLSAVFDEELGETREWSVDADFGLPSAPEGGSSVAPFKAAVITGWRAVTESAPADRPVDCSEGAPPNVTSSCEFEEEAETGVSDLKLSGPAITASAYVGAQVPLAFNFDFASSASSLPSFNLSAASTLPGAGLALSAPTFSPAAPDANSRRSPTESRSVTVSIPKTAQPGVYDVTLTAATAVGGSVSQSASLSQVAKLEVVKPNVGLGKVKFNRANGTALLFVKVPAAGNLIVSGKGIVKAKRTPKGPKTVKLPIKPKGKARALLSENGKARVKAKITFTPTGAAPVVKTKGIVLKKNLGA